jgi:hypothetical protein
MLFVILLLYHEYLNVRYRILLMNAVQCSVVVVDVAVLSCKRDATPTKLCGSKVDPRATVIFISF